MENQGIMLQNEGLKQSIINYKNNTNTSSTNELTMELMKSSFIIPFIKNNEKIKYILLKDNNGNLLHPIFTDLNEFAKLDPTLNYRILEFKEYLKILFEVPENFNGLIINPKTIAFIIPIELLINLTKIIP